MNICVDLDVDDLLWEMSKKDQKDMLIAILSEISDKDFKDVLDSLKSDKKNQLLSTKNQANLNEFDFSIMSLIGKSWRLTSDEESTIKNITEKYSYS